MGSHVVITHPNLIQNHSKNHPIIETSLEGLTAATEKLATVA